MRRIVFLGLAWLSCLLAYGQNLNRIEYFIDTDPGYGSGTSVPFTASSTVTDLTFEIDLASVGDGFHTLYIRSRDENGIWSVVQNRPFYRVPSSVTAAAPNVDRLEYFIDDDPGYGTATEVNVTPGASITDLTFEIDLASVADGFHTLYIRSRDENGRWSVVQNRPFYRVPSSVTAAAPNVDRLEYFIDNDPGYGSATEVNITPGANITDLTFEIELASVSDGFHTLYLRSRDENGNWSVVQSRPFYKVNTAANEISNIELVEYFIDTDPGYGSATAVTITPATSIEDLLFEVDLAGLSEGTHNLFVRSRDANGKWSIVQTKAFTVCEQPVPTATVATTVTATGFTANWEALSGITNSQLDVSADTFKTFVPTYNAKVVTGTSAVITGLSAATKYQYRLRAVGTCISVNSNVVNVETLLVAPTTPTATSATNIATTSFTANWNVVATATVYRLDVSTDNFVTKLSGYDDKEVSGTSDEVTGLTPGTAYRYRVRAVNSAGTSGSSASILVTTSKEEQSILFEALNPVVFGTTPFELAATASSGLAVAYTSSDVTVATISGNMLTIVGAGTTTITASQTGNTSYNAATSVEQVLVVEKAEQIITFEGLTPRGISDGSFELTATTSSSLPISYASSDETVATINGDIVTLLSVGTTTITASQAGDANYNPAVSVQQELTITPKTSQTITFDVLPAKIFGDAPFALTASATSGLAVSYSSSNENVATVTGSVLTIVGAGTTTITASQAGDATFNEAATVTQELVVNKATQTISFAALEQKTTADTPFELSASSTSGLSITFSSSNTAVATVSGNTVTITGAGETTLTASQAGSTNYEAAISVPQLLVVIAKQNQTITFPAINNKTVGDAAFTLNATASSNLAVSYASTSTTISISGSTVTLLAAGQAVITATQAGDELFFAADPIEQSFCINPTKPTITISGNDTAEPTLTSSATSGNQWFRNGTEIIGATAKTLTVQDEGAYTVQVTVDGCVSLKSEEFLIIVTGLEKRVPIALYPNPVRDQLTVISNGKVKGVISVDGRQVELPSFSDGSHIQIDVTTLAAGFFVLVLEEGKHTHRIRFTKVNE